MRQKLTTRVVEFLAHFHVRVRECARTGTFLLLMTCEIDHGECHCGCGHVGDMWAPIFGKP